jgi:hypothetical protein
MAELSTTTPPPKTLQDWRDEAYESIKNAVNNGGYHLLPLLMALGKTYAGGNFPADPEVDHPVTVLTKQINTRDQVRDHALEAGLDAGRIKMLPRFTEDCPTARGDHDDQNVPSIDMEWSELLKALQNQLVPPSWVHELMGGHMPCQQDGRCPYAAACDFDIEHIDLLIGHPVHANIESYVEGRAVLFDENAGGAFEYTVEASEFTKAINVLLKHHLNIDATSKDDLLRANEVQREQWRDAIFDLGGLVNPEIGYSNQGGRADAPLLALGILCGEPVENSEVTDTNLRRTEVGKTVVLHDEGTERDDPVIMVRNPPDALASAWSVVAMDGTPTQSIWEGRLGFDLQHHDDFMTTAERKSYIRDILGYNIVQLTPDRTVVATKAKNVSRWVFNAILHEIREKHNRMVPVITSQQAKESTIHSEYVSNKGLHFGRVRSRNTLSHETLLAVLGSIHPGDRAIQRLAALDGYAVESNGKRGLDKSYGDIGDRYYRHLVHHEIAQAIFRVAREEDVPGADIYVYSSLIPDWIPREVVDENPRAWSDEIEETIAVIEENGSATKSLIVNQTGHGERTVDRHLRKLKNLGYVDDVQGFGRYKEWVDDGLRDRNPHGIVDLES